MSDLVERALGLSRADGCVVVVRERGTANLRWAGNSLTTNGSGTERSLTVISVVGAAVGVRSASVVDDLEGLVRASEQAAREAGPAEDAGPLVEGSAQVDFGDPAPPVAPDVLAGFAADLGASLSAARADGLRLYGYASHEVATTWLGSSTGLGLRHSEPTGYVELTGKSDVPGASTWVGRHTRDWSDVAVDALEADVRQRLAWAQRRVELPAGRYEALLPPSAVADLLVYAYWTAAGREAAEGRTVFSRPGGGTRVGERLAPPGFRMRSDPAYSGAPFAVSTASSSTSSVFDNGLPLPATDWVSDGVLQSLVHTRATAAAAGAPVTPYVHNLLVDAGGTASLEDLVARTERGLLLTCLWYIREVDAPTLLLTGLTRDGVYLVEDGQVVGAVNNFRFNESPVDLLGRIGEAGAAQECLPRELSDYLTWTRMPPLRMEGFNMSSVSQAS